MERSSPVIEMDALRQVRDLVVRSGVQHDIDTSGTVRQAILRSWRRSAGEAVPTDRMAFRYLDPQGRSQLLRRAAAPVLDRLQGDLDGLRVAIFVSDHQGRIVARRASSAVQRNQLDNACAAEGFDFSERAVGTNGIGTVLEEKCALFVRGGEHFNDLLEPLTCAGAPILSRHTGRVAGSVALTCAANDTHPLMLPLARNAAREVEQALADLDGRRNRALLTALGPRSGSARRAPTVVLTSDTVLANPAGLQFVTPEHHALLWEAVTSRSWDGERPQTIELNLPSGRVLAAARRIVDPAGDAFWLEFFPDTRIRRTLAAPQPVSDGSLWPVSLHSVPAVDERLRNTLQLSRTIAIDGAPGTGKHHACRSIAACDPQHPVREIDLAAVRGHEPGWYVEAREVLAGGGSVVLRHVEELHPACVREVQALSQATADTANVHGSLPPGRLFLTVNLKGAPPHVVDVVRQTAPVVTLPELYQMREWIPGLAQTILAGLPGIAPGTSFSSAARQALMAFAWPGNVRELRQAMVEVAATRPGWLIQLEKLPLWLRDAARGRQLTAYERAERDAILAALQQAGGNRSKAAALLGIGRTTLYRKIQALRIEAPEEMAVLRAACG